MKTILSILTTLALLNIYFCLPTDDEAKLYNRVIDDVR